MSLKRMVLGIAIGMAAREGLRAVRRSGGLSGLQRSLTQSGGGGLGSMLRGGGGGLSGLLGGRAGGTLSGLAAMAGGSAMLNDGTSTLQRAERVDQGIDDEDLAGLMLRAMAQAVRADGRIDAEEEAALMDILEQGEDADRAALDAALNEPVDAAALAAQVPGSQGAQVYSAALMVINPDHPAELAYLDALADGLGIGSAERRQLHAAQDKAL